MTKYILCFICGIAVCLIFIYFPTGCNKIRTPTITSTKTLSIDTIRVDTIYIERDVQSVSFTGVGKLDTNNTNIMNSKLPIKIDSTGIIVLDNIYNTTLDKYILPEFIVYFDTIVNRDTFNLRYEFPLNLFRFDFMPHKDSIMFQQVTIEHKVAEQKTNWLTTLAIATGTGVLGYFIGSSRSK